MRLVERCISEAPIEHEVSVTSSMTALRCDEIVLSHQDMQRLLEMSPRRLQEWVSNMLTKFYPSEVKRHVG